MGHVVILLEGIILVTDCNFWMTSSGKDNYSDNDNIHFMWCVSLINVGALNVFVVLVHEVLKRFSIFVRAKFAISESFVI